MISVSLRRPDSPSLRYSIQLGTTIAIICTMIDAEMYGITPIVKMDRRSIAPPDRAFTMPKIVSLFVSKNCATAAGSMPGTGMYVPMR